MYIFKRFHGSTNSRRRQSRWGFDTKSAKNFKTRIVSVGLCESDSRPETEVTDTDQRWKLDDSMLKNKAGVWKSDDNWNFIPKHDGLICIENTSKTKILATTNDNKIIFEVFEQGKADQLWKKGKLDAEGYFTLEHFGVPKLITAISESGLEIKGNITLRWILLADYIFVDYLLCCFFTHRSK